MFVSSVCSRLSFCILEYALHQKEILTNDEWIFARHFFPLVFFNVHAYISNLYKNRIYFFRFCCVFGIHCGLTCCSKWNFFPFYLVFMSNKNGNWTRKKSIPYNKIYFGWMYKYGFCFQLFNWHCPQNWKMCECSFLFFLTSIWQKRTRFFFFFVFVWAKIGINEKTKNNKLCAKSTSESNLWKIYDTPNAEYSFVFYWKNNFFKKLSIFNNEVLKQ